MKASDFTRDELVALERAVISEINEIELRGYLWGASIEDMRARKRRLLSARNKVWAELHGTCAADVEGI